MNKSTRDRAIEVFKKTFDDNNGTLKGVLGAMINQDQSFTEEHFYQIVEGFNQARPKQKVGEEESARLHQQLFGDSGNAKELGENISGSEFKSATDNLAEYFLSQPSDGGEKNYNNNKKNQTFDTINKQRTMNKIKELKLKLSNLDNKERSIVTIIASLISALIIGYLFSDTAYYQTSYDFANGIRISKENYFYFREKGESDVFKKVTYNYLIFFSVLVIFTGLIYIYFQKQDRENKPGNVLEEAQRQARPLIINGYRKVGHERGCAPTSKTSDKKIIDVYTQVLNAFNSAAKIRDERIPAVKLNFIALKFFQVYEMIGEEGMNSHLDYEVEKYLEEGLRAEYNQELKLF